MSAVFTRELLYKWGLVCFIGFYTIFPKLPILNQGVSVGNHLLPGSSLSLSIIYW